MVQALGCGPADYEGHVKALVAAKKESLKERKSLMDELAGLHGQELAHQAAQQGVWPSVNVQSALTTSTCSTCSRSSEDPIAGHLPCFIACSTSSVCLSRALLLVSLMTLFR